ncbi:MAG TPA: hypothetical protein K8U78_00260 [Aeriscardovia aeriphila]|uniref:Uncharacterized protein n=1 Tax=Aeriscardovia aeriphila TaxID=218139 RepID=A0A921FUD1_9BIFI|nr:hypothetical protein [Aeriscardovia aeriphila]
MHYFTPKRCVQSGKIMYHTKQQCEQAAQDALIERGQQLWTYRCEYCNTWHLTHRDPSSSIATASDMAQWWKRKPHSRKKGFKPRRK